MKTDLLDIRNMDCMDLMSEYPDGHFDLAIVDPPYGIDIAKNGILGKNKFQIKNISMSCIEFQKTK